MTIQKKVFDFFLFTSFYIAVCAVVMVNETYVLLVEKPIDSNYLAFVFFSTVSSYNFHWLLSPKLVNPSSRLIWSMQHKGYHVFLFITGLLISIFLFSYLSSHWLWIGIGAFLTFLYSAPKIPIAPFQILKKIAYGKTIFLSLVWTYVTVILPLIIEKTAWSEKLVLFSIARFFFVYAICIIFDYRDRADDIVEGIKSLIIYLSEKSINILFAISIIISVILFLLLNKEGIPWINILFLILPVSIVALLFKPAKKNFSDYLYYFVLDGLMMLSGLLLLVMRWF